MINQTLKSIKEISVLAAFMQKDIDDINTHLEDLKRLGYQVIYCKRSYHTGKRL